ncbi:MAG: hypothetical protein KAI57_03445 [Candidatus Pacebacteria bacterium]|nr:hypothetical protein [Candidatus Paceibacterota bacterium]
MKQRISKLRAKNLITGLPLSCLYRNDIKYLSFRLERSEVRASGTEKSL